MQQKLNSKLALTPSGANVSCAADATRRHVAAATDAAAVNVTSRRVVAQSFAFNFRFKLTNWRSKLFAQHFSYSFSFAGCHLPLSPLLLFFLHVHLIISPYRCLCQFCFLIIFMIFFTIFTSFRYLKMQLWVYSKVCSCIVCAGGYASKLHWAIDVSILLWYKTIVEI